jgi:hypothetical protein
MTRKQSVLRNYKRLSPAKKVILFLKIQAKMSVIGSVFPNTSTIYTYLLGLAAINLITTELNIAISGGKGTADAVDKAVLKAEEFIDYWADIVDLISGGDPVIIVSSGFTPTKGETTPGVINEQPILDFTPQKQAGTILLDVKQISITVDHPTMTYIFGSNLDTLVRSGDLMYCTDETVRLLFINGKKEILVTGLPTGKPMQCVCVITSTAGVSTYSNVIKFTLP